MAEVYSVADRHLEHNMTTLIDFFRTFPRALMSEEVVINETSPSAIFYNISLLQLDIPLKAFSARLVTLRCSDTPKGNCVSA